MEPLDLTPIFVALVWACALHLIADKFAALVREGRITPTADEGREELPLDIRSIIVTAYPEVWAQEDALKAAGEAYERTQDWDLVRQQVLRWVPQPVTGDGDG